MHRKIRDGKNVADISDTLYDGNYRRLPTRRKESFPFNRYRDEVHEQTSYQSKPLTMKLGEDDAAESRRGGGGGGRERMTRA